ncbi:MAG: hypothetical protein EOO20_07315 [Chryseobacterium sp.]|nr:MAG: hypothetical protein EOO20_07315 [Chryseobacterium sp.]
MSRILLIFFFGMGTVECLHHDFSREHSPISTVKSIDSKFTSIQQYQLKCELCKSISNHAGSCFVSLEFKKQLDYHPDLIVLSFDFLQAQYATTTFTITGRGPPAGMC